MHRLSISAFVGMLALTITGCNSGAAENNTTTNVQPTVKPTASVKNESETSEEPTQKPALVAQNPQPPTSTAGLIQSTNVNQRTKQVQQGRSDPFAGLFAIPKPVVTVKPQPVVTAKPQKVVPQPKPSVAPPPPQPIVVRPQPLPVVPPPPIEPPQPDLARGISVLGVVEVGNEFQAIVRVPTEATSRYVSAGQRLSDGQVLVKRIEMYSGSEPVVVLEQNGIEVTRAVGEEPAQPQEENKTGRPSATNLSSPLSVNSSPSITGEFNSILQNQASTPIQVPPPPPTTKPSSNKQNQRTKPSIPPPPPTTSSLPDLQSNNYLPATTAVPEPDYPPPAVRTPSPAQQSNSQARTQRQRLIFQLLNSNRQPTRSSPAVKSNSQARTYKLLSRLVNRR